MKKIAIQGVRGAFHEMAARKYAGDQVGLVECMTFRELCKALKEGRADMAVMAIENTIAGSLLQNYSLINEYGLKVIGEIYLRIEMHLLALPGVGLSEIRHIHSHPIALMQCSDFLESLEDVTITETKDTAESARTIKEKDLKDTAAIAGENAAILYELEILRKSIETNKQNFTRFLAITNQYRQSEEDDKASVSFELGHHSGALADVLTVFKHHHINLTKIQSLPVVGKPYEYRFYADLTWERRQDFADAMEAVKQHIHHIDLLGTYKKAILIIRIMIIQKANRLRHVSEYYFSRKLQEIRDMQAKGIKVINLGIGSPDMAPSGETVKALSASAIDPKHHGYQSYRSIPELRKAIAGWNRKTYDIELDPETEILPLMGSKEGIMHISMAFLNAGDEVLVPDPGYPTYTSVSRLMEAGVRTYNLTETNNWTIDVGQLRKTDLSKVKIMWVNFPHMPTGKKADGHLMEELVQLAREKGFLICHDNPYSLILNDQPVSIFQIAGAKDVAIELNSLSKSHNMAGWRLGWVAGREDYINTILTVKSNFDSGMFLPIQHAAIQALQNDEAWHRQQNEAYGKRRELAWQLLDLLGCQYTKDQAGMFVWAKAPEHVQNVESFLDELLYGAHVFITPGFIFGANGEKYVRVSLCSSMEVLNEAIKRVKKYLVTETKHI